MQRIKLHVRVLGNFFQNSGNLVLLVAESNGIAHRLFSTVEKFQSGFFRDHDGIRFVKRRKAIALFHFEIKNIKKGAVNGREKWKKKMFFIFDQQLLWHGT